MVIITNKGNQIVDVIQFTDYDKVTERTLDRLTLELETAQGILTTRQVDGHIEVRPISGDLKIYEFYLNKQRELIPFNDQGYQSFRVSDTEIRVYHQ